MERVYYYKDNEIVKHGHRDYTAYTREIGGEVENPCRSIKDAMWIIDKFAEKIGNYNDLPTPLMLKIMITFGL